MSLCEFKNKLGSGFKLSNLISSQALFLEQIQSYKMQQKENSFFFYKNNLLTYFCNEEKDFKLSPTYTCVMFKNQKDFNKHKNFLEFNHFKISSTFKQMSLKKENINFKPENFFFLQKANDKDLDAVYEFFTRFFDRDYLFLCSLEELKQKLSCIYIYKEKDCIKGALFFSFYLNTAFLEFIAVERNLEFKNVAWALLNVFLAQDCKIFKLFVNENNQKAIDFYHRAGFEFNTTSLLFLKNF